MAQPSAPQEAKGLFEGQSKRTLKMAHLVKKGFNGRKEENFFRNEETYFPKKERRFEERLFHPEKETLKASERLI